MFQVSRCAKRFPGRVRWSSTSSETASTLPPLLQKMKADMLPAMRTKDTVRLNVLRAIISEANNAVHTPKPIKTDLQVLQVLRKRIASSEAAATEFAEAKREDLKEKQEAEIEVLQQYAGLVEMMSEADIYDAVTQAIKTSSESSPSPNTGAILKGLFRPGGALDGKPVDRAQVAIMVTESLQDKTTGQN